MRRQFDEDLIRSGMRKEGVSSSLLPWSLVSRRRMKRSRFSDVPGGQQLFRPARPAVATWNCVQPGVQLVGLTCRPWRPACRRGSSPTPWTARPDWPGGSRASMPWKFACGERRTRALTDARRFPPDHLTQFHSRRPLQGDRGPQLRPHQAELVEVERLVVVLLDQEAFATPPCFW